MIQNPLLAVGIMMLLAFWMGRAANMVNLPRVSGYLAAGILLSPSLFGILPKELVNYKLQVMTDISLGIIAYSIGGSLDYRRLKHLGKTILWITSTQASGAFIATFVILLLVLPFFPGLSNGTDDFLRSYLPISLVIGAISAATAPGAVLAIISELKARGPFTSTLLGVIALDDAVTIIFFAVAATMAHSLINPGTVRLIKMVEIPATEIGLSSVLGAACGFALKLMGKFIHRKEAILMITLGVLFSATGLVIIFDLSPILTNMVTGCFVINTQRGHHNFFTGLEQIEEPIFGIFFGLAGAHLDFMVMKVAGILSIIILVSRLVGKQLGALIGAKISRAPEMVTRYLGLALFPQAGVTIGLILAAQDIFPERLSEMLLNMVVGSVILNEMISPPLVKFCLRKAGEIAVIEGHTSQGTK